MAQISNFMWFIFIFHFQFVWKAKPSKCSVASPLLLPELKLLLLLLFASPLPQPQRKEPTGLSILLGVERKPSQTQAPAPRCWGLQRRDRPPRCTAAPVQTGSPSARRPLRLPGCRAAGTGARRPRRL